MSRSRPSANENPANRFFEWAGGEHDGYVQYYDKEKEQNIKEPMPFRFMPLGVVSCVTGFHSADETGMYSNEVRNIQKQTLTVKTFKGNEVANGLWDDIKDKINNVGGKFTNSVYIAYYDDLDQLQIGNIKFRGASIGVWIDLRKKYKRQIFEKAVSIYGMEEDSKGSVIYQKPKMKLIEIGEEAEKQAYDFDVTVQNYLDSVIGTAQVPETNQKQKNPEPPEAYSPEQPRASDQSPPPPLPHPNSPEAMENDGRFDDLDDDLPF